MVKRYGNMQYTRYIFPEQAIDDKTPNMQLNTCLLTLFTGLVTHMLCSEGYWVVPLWAYDDADDGEVEGSSSGGGYGQAGVVAGGSVESKVDTAYNYPGWMQGRLGCR